MLLLWKKVIPVRAHHFLIICRFHLTRKIPFIPQSKLNFWTLRRYKDEVKRQCYIYKYIDKHPNLKIKLVKGQDIFCENCVDNYGNEKCIADSQRNNSPRDQDIRVIRTKHLKMGTKYTVRQIWDMFSREELEHVMFEYQ